MGENGRTSNTYSITPQDQMSATLPSYSSVVSTCHPPKRPGSARLHVGPQKKVSSGMIYTPLALLRPKEGSEAFMIRGGTM